MSSRRDLVGKVFFSHYEPRVLDNEGRVMEGKAVRGGPLAGKGGGQTTDSAPL